MSNKRITELAPLSPAQLANDDLFPVADVSIPETKKITASDLASWIANSASLQCDSASYSDTASFLIFRGMGSNSNGTASFSISASWAALAYSASYVLSSSYSFSSSYAITASHCLNCSGAYLVSTASYLLYQGFPNGTASFALTASHALRSITSSYVFSSSITQTCVSSSYSTTSSFSFTASLAQTASRATFLASSATNGTASWATNAVTATTASEAARLRSTTNNNLFREWGPFSSSIVGTTTEAKTASFGFVEITGSGAKIIVEAWGSVWVSQSSDITFSGSVLLALSQSTATSGAFFELSEMKVQNYYTGSDWGLGNHLNTGSITVPFYLKGTLNNPDATDKFLVGVYAKNARFDTGSQAWQGVRCSLKVNNDTVFVDRSS